MKALVVYSTKTGNTKGIAEFIAEGIRFSGMQAKVQNIEEVAGPVEISGYAALVIGSGTYGGQMMEEMKGFLETVKTAGLEGKGGGAFGAYGWSGEAPEHIYEFMQEELKMKMVTDALRLKAAEIQGGMKMAQDYGRAVAELMESS